MLPLRQSLLVVAVFSLSLAGCGEGGVATHSVSGTVKVKGGGALTQGLVQFQSEQFTGSGSIDGEGKYTLSSAGEDDGVPAGTYKVLLLSTSTGGGYVPDGGTAEPEKRVIDSKYEAASTTDLSVEVPGGTYDFEVDAPAN